MKNLYRAVLWLLFVTTSFSADPGFASACFYANFRECSNQQVCSKATSYVSATERVWKDSGGLFANYVGEAKRRGLSCGVVTDIRALNGCGYSIERLKVIQAVLKDYGFYSSSLDGLMGPGTRSAIRRANELLGRGGTGQPCLTDEHLARLELGKNILRPSVDGGNENKLALLVRKNTILRDQLRGANVEIVSSGLASFPKVPTEAVTAVTLDNESGTDLNTGERDDLVTQVKSLSAELKKIRSTWVTPEVARNLQSQIADLESNLERSKSMTASERVEQLTKQLNAANQSIADIQDKTVPLAEHSQIVRQLSAANNTIFELRAKSQKFEEQAENLQTSLSSTEVELSNQEKLTNSLNESLVELNQNSVTRLKYNEIKNQLAAVNETLVDLKERTKREYVPKREFDRVANQLAATNATIADLRATLERDYKPLEEFIALGRQVAALNETVTVLTERTERYKTRWLDVQKMYDGFVQECRSEAYCAETMELE